MKRTPGLIIVLYGIARDSLSEKVTVDRPLIRILMTNDVWIRYICSPTISDFVGIRTRVATAVERTRHHCATRPFTRCYVHQRGKAGRYVLLDGPVYLRWKVMAIYAPRTERAAWRHGWELHERGTTTNECTINLTLQRYVRFRSWFLDVSLSLGHNYVTTNRTTSIRR